MTHGGGEALERRDARVDLTRLETRDGRLRGAHPLGDLALREPERLAPRREVPQEPTAIQRGLDEPGELGVTCRPLRDELVEEVRLAAHPSACHRSRLGASIPHLILVVNAAGVRRRAAASPRAYAEEAEDD